MNVLKEHLPSGVAKAGRVRVCRRCGKSVAWARRGGGWVLLHMNNYELGPDGKYQDHKQVCKPTTIDTLEGWND